MHPRSKTGLGIRAARRARGVSQLELGELIGVSYQQVQKYEKGATDISVTRLTQIADALKVPIDDLLNIRDAAAAEPPVLYGIPDDTQRLLAAWRGIGDEKVKDAIISLMERLAQRRPDPRG